MTEWVKGNLEITRGVLDAIEAAAVAAYKRDEEACGYLTGPSSSALLCDGATELPNLANKYHEIDPEGHPRTGHDYFKINALKFDKAIAASAAAQTPVKVFFHSHLDCGAYFSEEDAASMTGGGTSEPAYALSYLVTAVDKGEVTNHKLFIWNSETGSFDSSPFKVVSR